MIISEKKIEAVLEELEAQPEALEQHLEELRVAQPALVAYLFAEHMEAFTQAERDYFIFLLVVIWRVCKPFVSEGYLLTAEAVLESEETNWEVMQQTNERSFRKRLDLFFQSSKEEDLLAFLEDALAEEEADSPITKEGREPMFVSLKAIADLLLTR